MSKHIRQMVDKADMFAWKVWQCGYIDEATYRRYVVKLHRIEGDTKYARLERERAEALCRQSV